MTHQNLQHFCEQWFMVQTASMNSMFRLLGELSHQQTLALESKNTELFDRVSKMRNSIVGVVMDETNLTKRTEGYDKVFHNQLFEESAKRAGVVFPPVSEMAPDKEVQEFLDEVIAIEGYEALFAFLRATEHEAESIFEKMRILFEKHEAPKDAFVYIEVHEKIESLHDDESENAQNEFGIAGDVVDKYIKLWRNVLKHLGLV